MGIQATLTPMSTIITSLGAGGGNAGAVIAEDPPLSHISCDPADPSVCCTFSVASWEVTSITSPYPTAHTHSSTQHF